METHVFVNQLKGHYHNLNISLINEVTMFWYGVIVGVLGAWAFSEVFRGYPAAPAGLKMLGKKNYAVICAIGEALFPKGGDIPPDYMEAKVPQFIDEYLLAVPTLTRRLMLALFFLMEHATYIFAFTTRRLSSLPLEKRIKYFEGWELSRFYPRRMAFTSLRAIYGMAYLGNPEVEKAIGVKISGKCRDGLLIERRPS